MVCDGPPENVLADALDTFDFFQDEELQNWARDPYENGLLSEKGKSNR